VHAVLVPLLRAKAFLYGGRKANAHDSVRKDSILRLRIIRARAVVLCLNSQLSVVLGIIKLDNEPTPLSTQVCDLVDLATPAFFLIVERLVRIV
jgi:hypothetical protein